MNNRSSTTSSAKTSGLPWSICFGSVTSADFPRLRRIRFICVTDTVVAVWMKLVSSRLMKYSATSSRIFSGSVGGIEGELKIFSTFRATLCGKMVAEFA